MERIETEFEGHKVVYWTGGSGQPLLLLHGSGPGASTAGNWRLVLDRLCESFTVFAVDLIGFGESGRKTQQPYFDPDLWRRQAGFMVDLIGAPQVDILGHSLSGALVLRAAARDDRIRRVITTGTMGVEYEPGTHGTMVWTYPENEDDLRATAHILVADHTLIDDAYIAGRRRILFDDPDYKEYFSTMFAGDKQAFVDAMVLTPQELESIQQPVLLIHGRDDLPLPAECSLELGRRLPKADVMILDYCGHSVALEYPDKLVALARMFLIET